MQAIPINKVEDTFTEWSTALSVALTDAGYGVSLRRLEGGGHRVAIMHVKKDDQIYKIEFERKLIVEAGERIVLCGVEVYNPNGGLHVHMKGFSPKKVAKIVEYARQHIQKRIESEQRIEAKRSRNMKARELYDREMQGFEMPSWITVLANTDKDEDLGTFLLSFHEHRDSYGMARLTPDQIKKIVSFIQTTIKSA